MCVFILLLIKCVKLKRFRECFAELAISNDKNWAFVEFGILELRLIITYQSLGVIM